MTDAIQITAANPDPALWDLPWDIPLDCWPDSILAALPRGISRHIVRFVKLGDRIIAVKEISSRVAHHEYGMLRDLNRLEAPSVKPLAVVTHRTYINGEELNSALITEHLPFSLPYRALFSRVLKPSTAKRLIDSLAVLLVRLHLLGFYWGDVSLSNTLFRRDARGFAAYLVDAETGELHKTLTDGQRGYDVELARVNIIGELMDLQAGNFLEENADPVAIGNRIAERYGDLWTELTASEQFAMDEKWRVNARIKRLNDLGFEVGELNMVTDRFGTSLKIQPKVVDAGHYHRQVMRLMGLDVEEAQGKRMMNDLKTYQVITGRSKEPIELVAHAWLTEVFEPAVESVPAPMRKKLEPAQIFHEILEHRWYLSESKGTDVGFEEAVKSYIESQLPKKRDEQSLLDYDGPIDTRSSQ